MSDIISWAGIALIPLVLLFCVAVFLIMVVEDYFGIEIARVQSAKPWITHYWQQVESGEDEPGARMWCQHCDAFLTVREGIDGLPTDVLKTGSVELRPKDLERLLKEYSDRNRVYPRGTWLVVSMLLLLSLVGTQSSNDAVAIVSVLEASSMLLLILLLFARQWPGWDSGVGTDGD